MKTIALESVDFSKVMELPERYKGSDLRSRVALVQKYIEEIGEKKKKKNNLCTEILIYYQRD